MMSLAPLLLWAQTGGTLSGHVTNTATGAGIEGVRGLTSDYDVR
jgi:hypothetical protein